jgi:hypothetical protein
MSRSILKLKGTLKVNKNSEDNNNNEVNKNNQTLSSIYNTSKLKFGPINPIIDPLFESFLKLKDEKAMACLKTINDFSFEINNKLIYDKYEFHILFLKIYYLKNCIINILSEDFSRKIKNEYDPDGKELQKLVEVEEVKVESQLFKNVLSKLKEFPQISIIISKLYSNNESEKERANLKLEELVKLKLKELKINELLITEEFQGAGSNENNNNNKYIYKDVIINNILSIIESDESNGSDESDESNESIINRHICKELFNCEITSTGGNRINKIHKSLKELKTYAKKINITCSNKNKSELFKAIKQINLNNLKIDELKEYCKFFNIKGYSKYKNKKSLIKFINEHNI